MNAVGPFDRKFWIEDEVTYEHTPNVIHLNTPHARSHARANAEQGAIGLEQDRAEGRRLWDTYLAAIRRSVDAQNEVTAAHNAWMNYTQPKR